MMCIRTVSGTFHVHATDVRAVQQLDKVSPNCCISKYDGDKPTFKNPSGDY